MGGAGSRNSWRSHCKIPCETWWMLCPVQIRPPIAQIVSSLWTVSLTCEEAGQTSFVCLILLGLLGAYSKANT